MVSVGIQRLVSTHHLPPHKSGGGGIFPNIKLKVLSPDQIFIFGVGGGIAKHKTQSPKS